MNRIPFAPLALGLAGLIPFVWGALSALMPALALWAQDLIGPRFVGPFVQLSYGTIILSFMSGVLWGFATRTEGLRAAMGYALSVLPALWAFFMMGAGLERDSITLAAGFLAVLLIDYTFAQWGLTPPWWMRLRVLLTTIVVLSLGANLI